MKMLIQVEQGIDGRPALLTYECCEWPEGTPVEIATGRLAGQLGTVVGTSTYTFPYYEHAVLASNERIQDEMVRTPVRLLPGTFGNQERTP